MVTTAQSPAPYATHVPTHLPTVNTSHPSFPALSAAVGSEPSPLPSGWEQTTIPSGEVLYVNRTTKATTWERPVAPSVAVATPLIRNNELALPPGRTQRNAIDVKKRRLFHSPFCFSEAGNTTVKL
ncbi:unnamed protein product [Ascophyllum nodosum]